MNATRRKPYQEGRTGEDTLETSPFQDPVGEELATPRRGMSKVTMALGAGVILVAGVIIGIQAQKTFGDAGGTARGGGAAGAAQGASGPGGAGQGPNGQGGFGRGGFGPGGQGGGGFGNATIGTVKSIDGDTIRIETPQGATVTVRTSADTRVQVTKTGKVSDLEEGGTVVVQGERADDGTIDATAVSQGGGMRGGFGGPGRGGNGARNGGGNGGGG